MGMIYTYNVFHAIYTTIYTYTTLVLIMQESCDPTCTIVHCAGWRVCEYEIYFFILYSCPIV
jgi:hypothetical protein